MNISYFYTFIVVVEKGSFSEAAKALSLTQPAITFQVQALERHFKETLMERSGGKIMLTPAGQVFLKYARSIVDDYHAIKDEIDKMQQEVTGRLKLESSTIPGEYILPKLVGSFMARYPMVDVSLAISDSEKVLVHVKSGEADLGFIGTPPEEGDGSLTVQPFAEDELVLVVPPEHPLAASDKVRITDVLNEQWLLRERGSGTRATFIDALTKAGLSESDLATGMELTSNQAILGAVEAGMGVSVLSKWAAERGASTGAVKALRISDLDLTRRLYLVYLKERSRSKAQEAFIELALAV